MRGQTHTPKLYYVPSLNRFADDQWFIIHNLKDLFDMWQIDQWKRSECNGVLYDRNGTKWILYYLDEFEESDILENIDWNTSYGIKMDKMDIYER